MNRFFVYFWGLICHMGRNKHANPLDPRTHATLVNTPDGSHVPRVFFGPNDVVPLDRQHPRAVTFAHGNGDATPDEPLPGIVPFLESVPSLKNILDIGTTDAKPSVYARAVPHLHADYPRVSSGGSVKLKVVDFYPKLGEHLINGTSKRLGLVARLILADVRTTHEELAVRMHGHRDRTLTRESPCMLIANIEPPQPRRPPCDPADNHFLLYSALLDNGAEAIACDRSGHLATATFEGCLWVADIIRSRRKLTPAAATSTECGNTRWP